MISLNPQVLGNAEQDHHRIALSSRSLFSVAVNPQQPFRP